MGIRGRWKAWASLGWDTPAPKPCPHTLRRRIGKMGKDGNGLTCVGPLHSCTGSLHSPARAAPFLWKPIYESSNLLLALTNFI